MARDSQCSDEAIITQGNSGSGRVGEGGGQLCLKLMNGEKGVGPQQKMGIISWKNG